MKISAVYIAKNEAKNIARSLESVKDSVDELILVDTGSSDETVSIFEGYGGKVYYQAWQDDFSAPRNLALSKATGDWIILLDADEYFSEATRHNVRSVLSECDKAEAVLINIVNIDGDEAHVKDEFYNIRIVKNADGLAYSGKIHEDLYIGGSRPAPCFKADKATLEIYHTGYTKECSHCKAQRNLSILQKELEEGRNPAELYRYIFECYQGLGDREMALRYAWLDVQQGRRPVSYASPCYRYILTRLAENRTASGLLNRLDFARQAVSEFPELPEFHAEYAEALYGCYRFNEAAKEFSCSIRLFKDYDGIEPCLMDEDSIEKIKIRLHDAKEKCAAAGQLKISACLIARNEADNIEAWIDNVSVFADEIIIVDTGSADDTVSLAKEKGVECCQFSWVNDFAAARNYALERASGDWIVFTDADELFCYPEAIKGYLAVFSRNHEVSEQCILIPLHNIDKGDNNRETGVNNSPRIFKNTGNIKYIGRIHEQLSINGADASGIAFYNADMQLKALHTGYSSNISKEKAMRNLELLTCELDEADYPDRYYYYIAECCFSLGKYELALDYALKAIMSSFRPIGQIGDVYYVALEAMLELDYPVEDCLAVIREGLSEVPEAVDLIVINGIMLAKQAKWREALHALLKACDMHRAGEQDGAALESNHYQQLMSDVYNWTGVCYLELAEYSTALDYFNKALAENKWNDFSIAMLIKLADKDKVLASRIYSEMAQLYNDDGEHRALWYVLRSYGLEGYYSAILLEDYQIEAGLEEAIKGMSVKGLFRGAATDIKLLFCALLGANCNFTHHLSKEQLKLLPAPLRMLVCAYHDQDIDISDLAEDYIGMLDSAIRYTDSDILERYLLMAEVFSGESHKKIGIALAKRELYSFALYHFHKVNLDLADDEFWGCCGRCLFYVDELAAAMDCFSRIQECNATGEILAYMQWCKDGMAL